MWAYKTRPSEGGKVNPSFSQFVEKWEERRPFYEPIAIHTRWQERFPNQKVPVFNFHSDGPLLQRFYCQEIPQAPLVCRHLYDGYLALQSNPSSSKYLRFDMIAVAAFKQGLVKQQSASRADVRSAMQKYASELDLDKLVDFLLEQFSNRQANDLLQHSIKVESVMAPTSTNSKHILESGFHEYTNAGKLASVDTNAVLKDKKWKKLFSEL